MKGLVGGAVQGSAHCRKNRTTAEAARAAWGGGRYKAARSARREQGRSKTGIASLPHVKLAPMSAPGPTGERQEHLDGHRCTEGIDRYPPMCFDGHQGKAPTLCGWCCREVMWSWTWSERGVFVRILLTVGSENTYTFNETPWQQVVFASGADASDRPRPDGSQTGGYVTTLATEKLFGHGQEDDVSVTAWRSFKPPRKIAGSNNGETQATAFADESLWLAWLAWSEMHGAPMRRWDLAEAVRQVGGMLITEFLRYLRCLNEKRITTASIAKLSHK